jgi:hypothetical protein
LIAELHRLRTVPGTLFGPSQNCIDCVDDAIDRCPSGLFDHDIRANRISELYAVTDCGLGSFRQDFVQLLEQLPVFMFRFI